ncbi:MAG: enoyl-CoA hydratase/isomerase family protein [Ilumatobacteraceae bacterium]
MLQAGPEFAAWRSTRPPALMPTDDAPTVRAERHDDVVTVELHRPARHNAITSRLRDDLVAALTVAAVDDTVERVVLRGAGASFCSGGDLDEFGSRADPATAHRIRLARSPARLLHRLAARLHVQLHGAVLGGGIEMAAFAGRVTAHPDTRFGLPETRLGLVPGAGGTVSLPRRIGRQRTMALAIGTDTIGVDVALEWGLVDEIDATWNG